MTVQITTWNVNGLRATLGKGALDWARHSTPDILCLQEIKTFPEQLTEVQCEVFQGYRQAAWHPAVRPGYSGVATFSRVLPDEVQVGLGEPRYDEEGRVLISRYPGFTLLNLYVPNGKRQHDRLPYKLEFYADLLETCNRMTEAGERLVLCGDINTAHREIDLRNPKQNENTSGFLPQERAWIDRFIDHGFLDAYREKYPDREQYTWWTYRFQARRRNIGWRLDYFLVSESLMDVVEDVVIHEEILGSDHCPVSLYLNL